MAKSVNITTKIRETARQILEENPGGIRFTEIVDQVQRRLGDANRNTIQTTLQTYSTEGDVTKPSRGHWMLAKFAESGSADLGQETSTSSTLQTTEEQRFYTPFAEWLATVEEEVNEAVVVGGNSFRSKWATPDVIGTYKHKPSDPVKFELEMVSAEIKTDASQFVTAFGQACAYKLFSHKVYIVMPKSIEAVKDDLERLQALCNLFGMGLVLFEPNLSNPNFEKRIAARKFDPDIFYLNEFARRLQQTNRNAFDKLF